VEPPLAATEVIAFSSASRLTTCLGVMFSRTSFITSSPALLAAAFFPRSVAGTSFSPGRG